MKSYDTQGPLTISYAVGDGLVDIADGSVLALAIQRPLGVSSCRVDEIHVQVTETFTAVTLAAHILIGTASDADKFADLSMGVAAATDGYGTNDYAAAIKTAGKFIDLNRDGDSSASLDQLEVTTVANTGGTPAGIGTITVTLSWF
jgi:hypothetical protein